MTRRKRISFIAKRDVKKRVIVKFKRADGSFARFNATKIIRKPSKVSFLTKKKIYKK